ncbi:hypothetical protein KFK09_014896 [Dendrobium nobile]|uniref:SEC12-like protein 1 n=1 Tax=Dendrobium nobile TaxID=94219 RepID=A0A8T3B569_DENNO|nr:hypothetical protein KFK09_014896 [Dendrobium nobile]
MEGGSESCASWIRRPENRVLVVVGKPKIGVSLPLLEVFSFDVKTASLSADPLVTCAMGEEDGDPLGFAVHPSGEEIVCSTAKGCKLFELCDRDLIFKLVAKDLPPLHSVGPQKCLAFSTDGSKFVTGGQDEKIECCRFSRDGMRPFLFCTVQKGGKVVTAVWDISTWNRIGFKRLLRKPISALSVSLDGKYLALIVISTSNQRGAVITKLNVPADWKEWQIYFLLLVLFLGSAVIFYLFHEHSDSFWNFPLGRNQPNRPYLRTLVQDSQLADDQSPW